MAKMATMLAGVLFALVVTGAVYILGQEVDLAVTPRTDTPAQQKAEAAAAAGIKTPPPR